MTETERGEHAIEDEYRLLVETSPDCIHQIDRSGRFISMNPAGLAMLGLTDESDVVGMPFLNLVSERDKARLLGHFEDALEGVASECEFKTAHGSYFRASFVPMFDDAGNVVRLMGLTADVTDRVQAEARTVEYQERLRTLTAQLSKAEELERRRIAAELHDEISQTLAAARMKVSEAQRRLGTEAESLGEVMHLLDETVRHTRSLMHQISPRVLYDLGFEAAVQWLIGEFSDRHDIEIEFVTDGAAKPLAEPLGVFLFKGVRELLTNVVKHAEAGRVVVRLERSGDLLLATVEDDGSGFDTDKLLSVGKKDYGFGLFNIRDRLDYYGGSCSIRSAPNEGTTVVMSAPLESTGKSTEPSSPRSSPSTLP